MLRQLTRVASRNTRRISTIPSSGLKERLIESSVSEKLRAQTRIWSRYTRINARTSFAMQSANLFRSLRSLSHAQSPRSRPPSRRSRPSTATRSSTRSPSTSSSAAPARIKSMLWETSLLDPVEGIRFRGYSIPELQEKLPGFTGKDGEEPQPEGLFWLLMTGEVPTKAQADALTAELHARAELPAHVETMIRSFPKGMHPMTQLSSAILAMQTARRSSRTRTPRAPPRRCTGTTPTRT